jgi:hypothetical protein
MKTKTKKKKKMDENEPGKNKRNKPTRLEWLNSVETIPSIPYILEPYIPHLWRRWFIDREVDQEEEEDVVRNGRGAPRVCVWKEETKREKETWYNKLSVEVEV